jgi:hypothetical protein
LRVWVDNHPVTVKETDRAPGEFACARAPYADSADPTGSAVALHQVLRDNADRVRLLARELGLSPAARASLQLLPGSELPDIDAELGPPPRLRVVGDT